MYDIVLNTVFNTNKNTPRVLLLLIFCISQGSVVTRLRYDWKYDTSLGANLLLSPTVKEFGQYFSKL